MEVPSDKKDQKRSTRNGFEALPDDVIARIFRQLFDAKWLCRCSVVSKRFEAIIFTRIHRVTFSDANLMPDSYFDEVEIVEALVASVNLSRFPEIRHLHLELPHMNRYEFDPKIMADYDLVKWGADFDFGTNLDCFVFLALTSPFDHETARSDIFRRTLGKPERMTIGFCKEAKLRRFVMAAIVKTHPMIQSITITDKNQWGAKLCVSGERLVELREMACSKPLSTLWDEIIRSWPSKVKNFTLHALNLPVLRQLEIAIVPGRGGLTAAQVMSCFEGEDKLLHVVVSPIMEKLGDAIREL